jgi:hypothetical protein
MTDSGRPLRLDPEAASANSPEPVFVARPPGAPVYHGFPLVPESATDGWTYGAITEFEDPNGVSSGDGYVVAPDGRRAGLVWEVGAGEFSEILPPDDERWGVYAVWFPYPVRNTEDIVANFRVVLPQLQQVHARLFKHGAA